MKSKLQQAPLAIYKQHLKEGKLAYQFSPQAARAVFFPRLICPYSGSMDLEWRISAGRGTVYATTAVSNKDGSVHNVALIDLDEGFRMMSRVDGVPPMEVQIGLRVEVRFVEEGDADEPLPVFVALRKEDA